jgi:hypothetical protein
LPFLALLTAARLCFLSLFTRDIKFSITVFVVILATIMASMGTEDGREESMDVEYADAPNRNDYTYGELHVESRDEFCVTYKSRYRLLTVDQCRMIITKHKFKDVGTGYESDIVSTRQSRGGPAPTSGSAYGCETGTFILEANNAHSVSATCLYVDSGGRVTLRVPHVPCCPYVHLVMFLQGAFSDHSVKFKSLVHKNCIEYFEATGSQLLGDIFKPVAPHVLWYVSLVPVPSSGYARSLLCPPHIARRFARVDQSEDVKAIDAWRRNGATDFGRKHGMSLEAEIQQLVLNDRTSSALDVTGGSVTDGVDLYTRALVNVYRQHVTSMANDKIRKLTDLFNSRIHEMVDVASTLKTMDELFFSPAAQTKGHVAYFLTNEEEYRGVKGDPNMLESLRTMVHPMRSIDDTMIAFPIQLEQRLKAAQFNTTSYEWEPFVSGGVHSEDDLYSTVHSDPIERQRTMDARVVAKNLEHAMLTFTGKFYNDQVIPTCREAVAAIKEIVDSIDGDSPYRPPFVNMAHHMEKVVGEISTVGSSAKSTTSQYMACVKFYKYLVSLANNPDVTGEREEYNGIHVVHYDLEAIMDYQSSGLNFLKKYFAVINRHNTNALLKNVALLVDVYKNWVSDSMDLREWTFEKLERFVNIFKDDRLEDRVRDNFDKVTRYRTRLCGSVTTLDPIETLLGFTQLFERMDTMTVRQLLVIEGVQRLEAKRNDVTPTQHLTAVSDMMQMGAARVEKNTTLADIVGARVTEVVDDMKSFITYWEHGNQPSSGSKLQRRYGVKMNDTKQVLYWATSASYERFSDNLKVMYSVSAGTIETKETWRRSVLAGSPLTEWWSEADESLSSQSVGHEGMRQHFATINDCEYFESYLDVRETPVYKTDGDLKKLFVFVPVLTTSILPRGKREGAGGGLPGYLTAAADWWDKNVVVCFTEVVYKQLHEAVSMFDQKISAALFDMEKYKSALIHNIYGNVTKTLSGDNADSFRDHSSRWWRWLLFILSAEDPTSMSRVTKGFVVNADIRQFADTLVGSFYSHYKDVNVNAAALDNNEERRELFCRLMQDRTIGGDSGEGSSEGKTKYPYVYFNKDKEDPTAPAGRPTYELAKAMFGALVRRLATTINKTVRDKSKNLSHNIDQLTLLQDNKSFYHSIIQALANKCYLMTESALNRCVVDKPLMSQATVPPININLKIIKYRRDETVLERVDEKVRLSYVSQRENGRPDEYTGAYTLMYLFATNEIEFGEELLTRLLMLPESEWTSSERGVNVDDELNTGCSWGKKSDRYATLMTEGLRKDFQELSGSLAPIDETQRSDLINFLNSFLLDAILSSGYTAGDLSDQANIDKPSMVRGEDLLTAYSGQLARTIVDESLPTSKTDTTGTVPSAYVTAFLRERSMFSEVGMHVLTDYTPSYIKTGTAKTPRLDVHGQQYVSLSLLENLYTGDQEFPDSLTNARTFKATVVELVDRMGLTDGSSYEPVKKMLREQLPTFANPQSDTGNISVVELSDMMRPKFWNEVFVNSLLEIRKEWVTGGGGEVGSDASASIPSAKNLVFRLAEYQNKISEQHREFIPESLQAQEHIKRAKLMFASHGVNCTELVDTNRPLMAAIDTLQYNLPDLCSDEIIKIQVESIVIGGSGEGVGSSSSDSEDDPSLDSPLPPLPDAASVPIRPSIKPIIAPSRFKSRSIEESSDDNSDTDLPPRPPHSRAASAAAAVDTSLEQMLSQAFNQLSMVESSEPESGEETEDSLLKPDMAHTQLGLWESDRQSRLLLEELSAEITEQKRESTADITKAIDLLNQYRTPSSKVIYPPMHNKALRSHTTSADTSMVKSSRSGQYIIPSRQDSLKRWDTKRTKIDIQDSNAEVEGDLKYDYSDMLIVDEEGRVSEGEEEEEIESTFTHPRTTMQSKSYTPRSSVSEEREGTSVESDIEPSDSDSIFTNEEDDSDRALVEIQLDVNRFDYLTELCAELQLG